MAASIILSSQCFSETHEAELKVANPRVESISKLLGQAPSICGPRCPRRCSRPYRHAADRREFFGHARLVGTIYGAAKPDPAAMEFWSVSFRSFAE